MGRIPDRQPQLRPDGWLALLVQTAGFIVFVAVIVGAVLLMGQQSCDNATWTCW